MITATKAIYCAISSQGSIFVAGWAIPRFVVVQVEKRSILMSIILCIITNSGTIGHAQEYKVARPNKINTSDISLI